MLLQAYYGSRFSENMTRSPEGFLICHNVPLARTGIQEYLGSEVGRTEDTLIKVYRKPEEVFKKSTLASFEGKPVTDNHPAEFVEPGNATGYLRGTCTNVRRGAGDSADLIIGDLIIYDATLIAEIEAGKREISAGYLCDYRACDGGLEQCNIVCNHIAVVHNGRAGSRVAIKDSKPDNKKTIGGKKMSEKNILHRMLTVFMRDEETSPEEAQAALAAVSEPEQKRETTDEETIKKAVDAAVAPLLDRLAALESTQAKTEDEEPNEVEKLEKELSEDIDPSENEEKVTVEPEEIKDEDTVENVDKGTVLHMLKTLKPVIITLPEAQQKEVVDSFRATINAKKADESKNGGYVKALNRKVADSKVNNNSDFGEACRARNPHVKREVE